MVDSVVYSLIYGRIAVTLGCWLFFATKATRANKEAVVRTLSHDRRRFFSEAPGRETLAPKRLQARQPFANRSRPPVLLIDQIDLGNAKRHGSYILATAAAPREDVLESRV